VEQVGRRVERDRRVVVYHVVPLYNSIAVGKARGDEKPVRRRNYSVRNE
jgi:hypothetical protein